MREKRRRKEGELVLGRKREEGERVKGKKWEGDG